jgi:hypothetical protein
MDDGLAHLLQALEIPGLLGHDVIEGRAASSPDDMHGESSMSTVLPASP